MSWRTRARAAILVALGVLFASAAAIIAGIASRELPGEAGVAAIAVLGVVGIVTALAWQQTGARR